MVAKTASKPIEDPEDIVETIPEIPEPLTAWNRCDGTTQTGKNRASTSCRAQAYTRYVHSNGHDMELCHHHAVIYEPLLLAQGFTLALDCRDQLDATLGASEPLPPSPEGRAHGDGALA